MIQENSRTYYVSGGVDSPVISCDVWRSDNSAASFVVADFVRSEIDDRLREIGDISALLKRAQQKERLELTNDEQDLVFNILRFISHNQRITENFSVLCQIDVKSFESLSESIFNKMKAGRLTLQTHA